MHICEDGPLGHGGKGDGFHLRTTFKYFPIEVMNNQDQHKYHSSELNYLELSYLEGISIENKQPAYLIYKTVRV